MAGLCGAECYALLGGVPIEIYPRFKGEITPLVWNFAPYDELSPMITGAKIADVRLAQHRCELILLKDGAQMRLKFTRSDERLPMSNLAYEKGGMGPICYFAKKVRY